MIDAIQYNEQLENSWEPHVRNFSVVISDFFRKSWILNDALLPLVQVLHCKISLFPSKYQWDTGGGFVICVCILVLV